MERNPLTKMTAVFLLGLAGVSLLAVAVAAQTGPADFTGSSVSGPVYAHPGAVISFTIVAVNAGGPVQAVALSDTLPSGTEFVPGSCSYRDAVGVWPCDQYAPNPMWRENFAAGGRITTTFAATVTAGTLRFPLVNRAYLAWDGGRQEMVFTTTVLDAFPDFAGSYKVGSPQAEAGDLLTYTIVAVNSGDPVTGVVLSDPLPDGAAFVACRYEDGETILSCEPPTLWTRSLAHGGRITTTMTLRLTAGTLRWPLRNCARLAWEGLQKEMCAVTLANPTAYVYLPLVLRNYAPFNNGDFSDGLRWWGVGSSGGMQVALVTELYDGERVAGQAAILGGDDEVYEDGEVPLGYGALWRAIYVPDSPDAALTIRYRVVSHDVVFGQQTARYFDDLEVAIDRKPWEATNAERNAAGCDGTAPVPAVLDADSSGMLFCDGNRSGRPTGSDDLYDSGWKTVTVNLGPSLRGRQITLYLVNFNRVDHFWNTWSYIDWVSVSW